MNDYGLVIQAKNTSTALGWAQVATEINKMGKFSIFVHYILAAMNLSKGLQNLTLNQGFIFLPAGRYYYTKDGHLLHENNDQPKQFSAISEHGKKRLKRCDPITEKGDPVIKIGDIFLRDDVNWSFFPSDFDEQQFFDVPSNSCCIVLGTRGMKNLLGDETFRLINEKLLEPNSKERNDFHARFINSLFDSTPDYSIANSNPTMIDSDERALKRQKITRDPRRIYLSYSRKIREIEIYSISFDQLLTIIEKKLQIPTTKRVNSIKKKLESIEVNVEDDDDVNLLKSGDILEIESKVEQQI
eukprot:gb/GECH01010056.1/.p1 GENE.gb/GECH01010056.1/~~gb/GECH01010056.1/.p1  ORF type:complete len:300 (+),score=30.36 gb/GECH01010056.1/:1-900(+)